MDDAEMLGYVHRTIEAASHVRKQVQRDRDLGVSISIHVSNDVYLWLLHRAQQKTSYDAPVLFGFPVVREDSWGIGDRIEVHTRRVIV